MGKNTSITLDPHFQTFIHNQLETGRYRSTSEVIRAGLRLLENREARLAVLRQMLEAGEQSGVADYSYEDLIAELDRESAQ